MPIKYVTPSNHDVDIAAQSICRELGQHNPAFLVPDVWHGFATYLKIVLAIHVRIMNAQQDYTGSQTDQIHVA